MLCTLVIHAGYTKWACNICNIDPLPCANDSWMGCPSFWTHPLPSSNNNERPCRGRSMHAELESTDTICRKPPMCTSATRSSHCIGRGLWTETCVSCELCLVISVSCTMYCRIYYQDGNYVPIFLHECDVGACLPLSHMLALKTHWPSLNTVFCGEFLVPRARWAGRDWTIHNIVWGWKELDDTWLKPSHNSDNIIWTNVHCKLDWQLQKHPEMLVLKIQRCCTQLNTNLEHAQNFTYVNHCSTWKHTIHTAK